MSRRFKYFGFGGRGTTFTFLRKGCYSEQQAICTVFLSTPALVELKMSIQIGYSPMLLEPV